MLCQAQLGSRAPPINHGARRRLRKIPEYPVSIRFQIWRRYEEKCLEYRKTVGTDSPNLPVNDTGNKMPDQRLTWRADLGSALFGGSDTVQPKGLFVQCLIRYAA